MQNVIIKIITPQELNHSSYVQTGLFELEKEGFLKTDVHLSFSKRLGSIKVLDDSVAETMQPHPKTSFYELTILKTGKKIHFATDLYDASTSFSKYALEHCDFVFKRNFEENIIKTLPEKYQEKLYPLGLTFGCHSESKKQWYTFIVGYVGITLQLHFKMDSYFFKRIKRGIIAIKGHLKHVNTTRLIAGFENYNKVKLSSTILFQTRCFSNENSLDVKSIHEQRYSIIKLLSEKYPLNFKGGFISSNFARLNYGDALTNLPTDSSSYLALVKNSKIVIYTRGLVHSPAWKMAEYLSQGKVIIAEKLTTDLPVPLQNEKELLFFENEKELIELIDKVLGDEKLCEILSYNAKNYFDTYVHPKENMRRMISLMLNQND